MNIIDSLKWRYAVKAFAPNVTMSAEQEATLTEAFRLTPTSFGMYPIKLIKVEDVETRQALVAQSFGQDKVANAGHLWVIAVETDLGDASVDRYTQLISTTRGIPAEKLGELGGRIKGSISRKSEAERTEWAKRQAYIGLGNLMTVAALEGVDACPMEGFNPAGYDEVLGLADKNLTTAVLLTLGQRSDEDGFQKLAKVRKSADDAIITI